MAQCVHPQYPDRPDVVPRTAHSPISIRYARHHVHSVPVGNISLECCVPLRLSGRFLPEGLVVLLFLTFLFSFYLQRKPRGAGRSGLNREAILDNRQKRVPAGNIECCILLAYSKRALEDGRRIARIASLFQILQNGLSALRTNLRFLLESGLVCV
jgi:hypothetical protein